MYLYGSLSTCLVDLCSIFFAGGTSFIAEKDITAIKVCMPSKKQPDWSLAHPACFKISDCYLIRIYTYLMSLFARSFISSLWKTSASLSLKLNLTS